MATDSSSNFHLQSVVASLWPLIVAVGLALNAQSVDAQNSCNNPNNKPGTCISIYECPSLLNSIKNVSRSAEETKFLLASQCGQTTPPIVCCTSDSKYEENEYGLLANLSVCGRESIGNKIYNGKDTKLDDYPWMVLLEYRDKTGALVLNCGGSLINKRYVVTAAHCIKGAIEKEVGPLTRVRLGEYNTNEEIDCIDQDCNYKVVEVGFEEAIPHPQYDIRNSNNYHDIALIRLAQEVEYTDFIKPVCLPLPSTRQEITPGELLVVAGWGRTLEARTSNVKQSLAIPVNEQAACAQKFSSKKINLISSQFCAGGEFVKDSCDGDSGGPLMRKSTISKRLYLEGVVSFGNKCGLEGWPGVYTRVADYVSWIQQTMKP